MKKLIRLLMLFVFTLPVHTVSAVQEIVDTRLYAPYAFYQHYDYPGEGNEFVPFQAKLQYAPDENGVYQASVSTAGTTVVYVYQLSKSGVFELAYFPENYGDEDMRNHPDAVDDIKSLVFPASLHVGDDIVRGYSQHKETYTVANIEANYSIGDAWYPNVLVLEKVGTEGYTQRLYYAPGVGVIKDEYIDDEFPDAPMVAQLETIKGPSSYGISLMNRALLELPE